MNQSLFQYLLDETEQRPMTVTELGAGVRELVERGFRSVWVEGEIVNFVHAASGHWYFSLNDGTSQIKCVCWRGTNFRIRFKPKDGVTVRIRGRLTFWETKGELKLAVDTLDPSGEGALAAAFEQIKSKLESEGLFAPDLKRKIPFFPRRVGVVTSRTGAAYHDICTILTRRARSVSILLIPAMVQGEGAADSIRRAIIAANAYSRDLPPKRRIDVLIVGRGGGSAEDLWAFNDELLARHIRSSDIPVISAVGHEIDWTISDFVADLRAATPSAAAELVAQRQDEIEAAIAARHRQLGTLIAHQLAVEVNWVNECSARLEAACKSTAILANTRFDKVSTRLSSHRLESLAVEVGHRLHLLDQRRRSAIERTLNTKTEILNLRMATLDAISPLSVLRRGYSITQSAEGRILRDAKAAKSGDKLKIRLEHGKLDAEVLSSE